MKIRITLIASLVCSLSVLAATASAATNMIQIYNFDFGLAPSTHIDPTISPGDTVQWVWVNGSTIHSTTASPGQLESWDSGVHSPPFTFSHTFTEVGTYNYYCSVHGFSNSCATAGGMSGHVFVVLAGASPVHITAITREANDIRVSWTTTGICTTDVLQRATRAVNGSYTNNFSDIFSVAITSTNKVGIVTNFLDVGAANFPARYYRVRMVP